MIDPRTRRWLWCSVLVLGAALAGCRTEGGAQQFFDAGARAYQKKDYDDAIAAYRKGLLREPGSAVGYNLLGMAYRMKYNTVRSNDWKEKEVLAFRQSVAADSTFWPAYINLGVTLYYLGKKDEAAPYFRRALELNPRNPERTQIETFIQDGSGTVPEADRAAPEAP